jgi:hypothetical protein
MCGFPATSAISKSRRTARRQSAAADLRRPLPVQKTYELPFAIVCSASTATFGNGT